MHSSIVEITQNREFLESIRKGWSYGSNLNILSSLPPYNECSKFHSNKNELTFNKIFGSPLGFYLIKCFLVLNHNDDKAVFVSDVKLYKSLTDPSARIHISKKIYLKYCSYHSCNQTPQNQFQRGISVFETSQNNKEESSDNNNNNNNKNNYDSEDLKEQSDTDHSNNISNINNKVQGYRSNYLQLASQSHTDRNTSKKDHNTTYRNALDIYGDCIDVCFNRIFNSHSSDIHMFNTILSRVLFDLETNIFPLFIGSSLYKLYIQCQTYIYNRNKLSISSFITLRVLGRGAFGFVNAVIKKNTGYIYAMKCINKKRVMATDSVETIMSERNFLSDMNSNFVTGLKYAVMDDNTLYLIIDLMVGGDLKFHLNKEGRFNIEKSRFYAASVLLGLQHIHSKGIVYRDIKLENVLLGSDGNCKISDLGLAVRSKKHVRGYAGTPGYTAPEVCLQQSYHFKADFFSFGVMIYRFLSGRKPFQIKTKNKNKNVNKDDKDKNNKKKKDGHRTGNELDKNVVEIEPEYPDRYFTPSARSLLKGLMCKNPKYRLSDIIEIKSHPWFYTKIDFGLLESGNLIPNFIPNQDEINADSLRHIGRPPNDDKYKDVKITKDFQLSLSKFPFSSNKQQQYEIINVLKKIKKYYSFKQFINIINIFNNNSGNNNNNNNMSENDIINKLTNNKYSDKELYKYAQNLRNNKNKYGNNSFIPKYYTQNNNKVRNSINSNNNKNNKNNNNKNSDNKRDKSESDKSIGHHYSVDKHNDKYKLIKTNDNHKEEEEEEEIEQEEHTESSVSHSNVSKQKEEINNHNHKNMNNNKIIRAHHSPINNKKPKGNTNQ